MKILAKVTFKEGEKTKRLTLKVDGKGDEAELEIVFGESQIELAEEAKPKVLEERIAPAIVDEEKIVEPHPIPEEPAAEAEPSIEEEVQEPLAVVDTAIEEEAADDDVLPVQEEENAEEPSALENPEVVSVPHSQEEIPEEENADIPIPEEPVAAAEHHIEEEVHEPSEGTDAEEPKPKASKVKSTGKGKGKKPAPKMAEGEKIAKVAEIAAQSSNFGEFVQKVADWLELNGNNRVYFVEVVNAASQIGKITWPNIEKALNDHKVCWGQWNKIQSSKRVTEKFEEINSDVQIMTLIKEMATYLDFEFVQPETMVRLVRQEETVTVGEPIVDALKNQDSDETSNQPSIKNDEKPEPEKVEPHVKEEAINPKENPPHVTKRVKMAYMPEIPWFEEELGRMDKTKPTEAKVRYVLKAMGMDKQEDFNPQMMFEIANAAVRSNMISRPDHLDTSERQDTCLKSIFRMAGVSDVMHVIVRMKFTSFVNEFIEKNATDGAKAVKLIHFLSSLKTLVTSK